MKKAIIVALFIVFASLILFTSIKPTIASPGSYTITIRSGAHTVQATSCVISRDPEWAAYNFDPEVNLVPGESRSWTTPDINHELGGIATDFTMVYALDGEVKQITIGPDPPLVLGQWYRLCSSFEEYAEVRITEVAAVGGISVPVDKFDSLAPYIGLASAMLVATAATATCFKRVKRRREKQ